MKLPIQISYGGNKLLLAGVLSAFALLADKATAEPTEVNFSDPAVSGNGEPGTTALFPNVATQGGVGIDMKATVIEATPGKVATFSRINGNDFRLDAGAGGNTGTRFFRVRYQFFETGTTTPRAIDEMAWSIGDLDLTTDRTESVVVRGAASYLTESFSVLDVSENAQTITAAGTQDMDQDDPDGNSEAVVSFNFVNRAVIEITYHVKDGGGGYFDHVADGAFPFYQPKQTVFGVYYTFDITNSEEIPVKMDFVDTLPVGLKWDPDYEPVVAGAMADIAGANGQDFALREHLNFEESDQKVSFSGIPVPPGLGTFTLKTMATQEHGVYENTAVTVQSSDSGFPPVEMVSHSVFEIPDPGPVPPEGPAGTLVETFKATLCSYALFQLGEEAKASGSASVGGDVAVAPGASVDVDTIDGDVITHNPPSANLSNDRTTAIGLAEDFAALAPTQTFGTLDSTMTINGGAADGVNVIAIDQISLSSGKELTLNGSSKDWFIINVGSKFSLSGSSKIVLSGVPPSKVLFNISASVGKVTLSGSSGALGMTILAPYSEVSLSGSSNIIGSVIAGDKTSMSGSARISGLANFGGSCGGGSPGDPDPGPDPVDTFIDDFTASDLGRFGWFSIGGTVHMNDWTNTIYGHVGIGPGTLMNFSKGTITGDYVVDPTVTEKNGAVDDLPGTAMGNPISSTIENLAAYKDAALTLNLQAAALPATRTFGEISETYTLAATNPDGFNVIAIETLSMGTGRTFTINGGADDWFIFNISKELKFAGGAIAVSGVPGNQILFNLLPGASEAKFDGDFTIDATVLSPHSAVNLTGAATVTGSIISGMNASMSGQATITQTSPFGR